MTRKNLILDCRGKRLDFSSHTHIMGIINCTPDSFYAGSRAFDHKRAIAVGERMAEEGADILDIGGESTRPGAEPVSATEELRRVMPVIEGLLDRVSVPLSIDTFKSEVAERALQAGTHLLNDISALAFDPEMGQTAAQFGVPVILMHIKGTPKNMQKNPTYMNLMQELQDYFRVRINVALEQGVAKEKIVLDPGIGFGKRLEDNYEILRRLREFEPFGCPILVGPSRKSFIGRVLQLPPEESLEGTIAAATVAILNGAQIVRVHDVKAIARAAKIADKLVTKNSGHSR